MTSSPQVLEREEERERFLAAIQEGLEDIGAGRVVDDEELEAALEALDQVEEARSLGNPSRSESERGHS